MTPKIGPRRPPPSLLLVALLSMGCAPAKPAPPLSPIASTTLHGVVVNDPFRWLEDDASPAVRDFEKREDQAARRFLTQLPLRESIRRRLHEVSYDHQAPGPSNKPSHPYVFQRRKPDQDRGVLYVRETDGSDRVLLDPNRWGKSTLRKYVVSPDGELVAYAVSHRNAERATVHIVRVSTGQKLSDEIRDLEDSLPTWRPDSTSFYYTHTDYPGDPATRFGRETIREHRLGTDPATDAIIFPSTGDPRTSLRLQITGDGRWGITTIQHGAGRSELFLRELSDPSSAWVAVPSRDSGANVTLQAKRSSFLLLTDDGAPNGRVVELTPKSARDWSEVTLVEEDPTHALRNVTAADHRLILLYWDNGSQRLVVTDEHGMGPRVVPVPTPDDLWAWPGPEGAIDLRVSSQSRAPETWRVNLDTNVTTVRSREDRAVDLSRYTTELVFATSKDGTRVPMFVTRPRDQRGPLPTYLYGYGGFRVSMTSPFDPYVIPWLEHGGVSVVVITRGGMEYGEAWHRAGMQRHKQNVFDDFTAATERLLTSGIAARGKVVMKGWSNGGLLASALVTQHPDLYRAAIVGVPLADMIRFGDYGQGGMTELGDVADEADFNALFAYSPYHHVAPRTDYPSLLITMAENDENAHPMHARKIAAAFQASDTKNPVLLRVRWDAAHAGSGSASEAEEEQAEELAFLMDAVGMK